MFGMQSIKKGEIYMTPSYIYALANMMPHQLEQELKKWEQKAKRNPNISENDEAIDCIEGLIREKQALIEKEIINCE